MSTTPNKVSYQEAESVIRYSSRVPDITASTTVPLNNATGVPINQTISIASPVALDATTINGTNITMSPSVARTTSLQLDGRTVLIDPTSSLPNNTLCTLIVTTAVKGYFGGWGRVSFTTPFTFSFTTVP